MGMALTPEQLMKIAKQVEQLKAIPEARISQLTVEDHLIYLAPGGSPGHYKVRGITNNKSGQRDV